MAIDTHYIIDYEAKKATIEFIAEVLMTRKIDRILCVGVLWNGH